MVVLIWDLHKDKWRKMKKLWFPLSLPVWVWHEYHFISVLHPCRLWLFPSPRLLCHLSSLPLSNRIIHLTLSSPSSRGACGSIRGQPLQAVAPPSGPGVPLPQMHLHMLQRPGTAAAPAEACWDQTVPVSALLLWQQSAQPARGASTPRAQGQLESAVWSHEVLINFSIHNVTGFDLKSRTNMNMNHNLSCFWKAPTDFRG